MSANAEWNAEWHLVCCCIPRFLLGLFLSCYLFFSSAAWILDWAWVLLVRRTASMTPIHCSGFHCTDVLTCDATKEATYHVRMVWSYLGGLIFGYLGIFGVWNRKPYKLHCFSMYVLSLAVLLCVIFLADAYYLENCGGYTYNVIEEAVVMRPLRWLAPDVPVPIGIKIEVLHMQEWSPAYVDKRTHLKVWKLYAACVLSRALAWFFVFREMATLTQYVAFGMLGLGPTYSLNAWKDQVEAKNEFGKYWKNVANDVEAMEDELPIEAIEFLEDDLFQEFGQGPGGYGTATPAKSASGKGKVGFKRYAGQLAGL